MEKRLTDILRFYKLSPSAFADKLGIQRSSISHILSGRNKPSFDFLSRMMDKFPDINIEWFINGKEQMLKQETDYPSEKTLFHTVQQEKMKTDEKFEDNEYHTKERDNDKITNVNKEKFTSVKSAKKIIVLYDDQTWQEFLAAGI